MNMNEIKELTLEEEELVSGGKKAIVKDRKTDNNNNNGNGNNDGQKKYLEDYVADAVKNFADRVVDRYKDFDTIKLPDLTNEPVPMPMIPDPIF